MQHQQSMITAPVLDGRVFARQQLFMTLPSMLQEDAKQFRTFVEQDKTRLFKNHHHALIKSVYSVKGGELIDAVIQWLRMRYTPAKEATSDGGLDTSSPSGTISSQASTTETSTEFSEVTKAQLETAKQLAEALVLLGFITPYKEDEAQLTCIAADHYVRASELLIPVAPGVTDLTTTSVWSIADRAVYARSLKRKAGMLGAFTQGKDIYVVFNDETKAAYLFESDLAREAILELSGATLNVQFDSSQFDFGVRVSLSASAKTDTIELFNAETMEIQAELVKAWLGIGARFEETSRPKSPPKSHSNDQYVGTFADVPDHSVIGYVPSALVHGQQADPAPTGGESHGGHSIAATHNDQLLAPEAVGTAAYAPVVTKPNHNSTDEQPAPHVAP